MVETIFERILGAWIPGVGHPGVHAISENGESLIKFWLGCNIANLIGVGREVGEFFFGALCEVRIKAGTDFGSVREGGGSMWIGPVVREDEENVGPLICQ